MAGEKKSRKRRISGSCIFFLKKKKKKDTLRVDWEDIESIEKGSRVSDRRSSALFNMSYNVKW